MRKINFLFVVILISLVLLSIASLSFGQNTKKTIELPEFKSIYVNSNYTVYLKQTNKQEVTVEALAEIFQITDIKVENGILMVNVERKPENPNKSLLAKIDDIKLNPMMKIYVSMRNISDLQVNGGGKIISENSIAAENINLGVAGNGSLDIDLKGNVVKAEVTGSGTLNIKGYATSIDAMLGGSGNLTAFNCPVETAKFKLSGSGNGELNVASTLEATVMGSGNLKHKGNTKNVSKKVYGTGTVERAY